MLKAAWKEFKLFFRNPRDIHRVLMVIPLAALLSHFVYLYIKMPLGVPITKDESITIALGIFMYLVLTTWVFLSNPWDIELGARFLWSGLLSVAIHRVYVGKEVFGSSYITAISIAALLMVMVFVVTGKTKSELKIWLNRKLAERKNAKPAKIYAFNPDDDGQRSNTG